MFNLSGKLNSKTVFTFMFLIILTLELACNKKTKLDNGVQQQMPKRDINEVKEAHTSELMALPGVVGVYIGLMDDEQTMCIKVMVLEKTPALDKKIPETLEGYPVLIEETGEIRPMPKE